MRKTQKNLNQLKSRFYHGKNLVGGQFVPQYSVQSLHDYSASSVESSAPLSVYFDNIEGEIVNQIRKYDVAVGAVAWLSNPNILSALSKLDNTAIVIQKEDFLRPDAEHDSFSTRTTRLRHQYRELSPFESSDFNETYPGQQEEEQDYNSAVQHWLFDASGDYQFDGPAVRCIGYSAFDGKIIPRMHHKFLVLGYKCEGLVMKPRVVLTGSFNMTINATKSRENALVIREHKLCHAYLSEWAQLWSMSEVLDWTNEEPSIPTIDMST